MGGRATRLRIYRESACAIQQMRSHSLSDNAPKIVGSFGVENGRRMRPGLEVLEASYPLSYPDIELRYAQNVLPPQLKLRILQLWPQPLLELAHVCKNFAQPA